MKFRGLPAYFRRVWRTRFRRRPEEGKSPSDAHLRCLIWRVAYELDDAKKLAIVTHEYPARVRTQLHAILTRLIQSGQRGDWADITEWGMDDLLTTLIPIADAESARLIVSLLEHPKARVVDDARCALIQMALPESVAPIAQLLREAPLDQDLKISSAFYLARERFGPSNVFGRSIIDALAERMDRTVTFEAAEVARAKQDDEQFFSQANWIPRAMLLANREKAVAVFLAPERWTYENPLLKEILRELYNKRVLLEISQLDRLLNTDPRYINAHLVYLMALVKHPATPQTIDRMRMEGRSFDAAFSLCLWRGVPEPYYPDISIASSNPSPKYDMLTKEQQWAWAISKILSRRAHIGLHNALHTYTGDYFNDAIVGLDAIGATWHAAAFREIAAFFGPTGPFRDTDKRCDEIRSLTEEQHARIHQIDSAMSRTQENVRALLLFFVAEHADQFGGRL